MLGRVIALLLLPCVCIAGSLEIYLENDLLSPVKSDANYTHGTRVMYYGDKKDIGKGVFKEVGYAGGQYIYTPVDLESTGVVTNQRPYAGWLYISRLIRETTPRYRTTAELQLGMVGPLSFAEDVQTTIHEWSDSTIPMGWDNQIGNEVGLNFNYKKHYAIKRWRYADVVWGYGLSLGNVYSGANSDVAIRLGLIGDTFIPPQAEPTAKFNNHQLYIFARGNGRYVAHNIFLDGSILRDEIYTVNSSPFVGEIETGVHYANDRFFTQIGYFMRTKEFEESEENHSIFGSIKIGYKFN
jgi:lipid A 3-O-deacylase